MEGKPIPLLQRRTSERQRRAEREFLPAALEIIETPVSPAGRIMMGVIALLIVVGVVWACIGRLDIVATANGRVIPSGQIKLIQPLEIGVVHRINVAEGDHVAAGESLIELDPTSNAADRDKIEHDLMQAELEIARLRAVLSEAPERFAPSPLADPALVDGSLRQLMAQLAQHKAKLAGIDRQIAAKTAEREQAKSLIEKLDASIPLLQQKFDVYQQLLLNKYTSTIARLEAERQLSEATHDRATAVHQVEAAEANIAALTQQRIEADADFHRQAFDDLRKTIQYAAEQREDLIKAKRRTGLQVLRAPVSGTIEQVSVHTIGGVVQPAQTLMVVVPDNSKLEVEAMLPNRDAGFVHAGQPAEVKVEAFTYTRYGLLHGEVRLVSRDALHSERDAPDPDREQEAGKSSARGAQSSSPADSAYVARISLAEATVETEQGPIPLEPGMTVTAEIKTGDRPLITYLLSPFMRYRHEALRER
jgi:hemolysin D